MQIGGRKSIFFILLAASTRTRVIIIIILLNLLRGDLKDRYNKAGISYTE